MNNYLYYSTNPLLINKKSLNNEMKEFISDSDLTYYLGKNFKKNIIKYSDIDDYSTIDKLLPGKKSYKIILIEDTYNSGHWVCLMRNGSTLEYFNSYGLKPSVELDGLPKLVNKQLDQDVKHLNILLNKALSKYDIIYNKVKFQKLENNVNTCGKWVLIRVMLFKKLSMDLYQFIQFIDEVKKKLKLSSDQVVTLLVKKPDNNKNNI